MCREWMQLAGGQCVELFLPLCNWGSGRIFFLSSFKREYDCEVLQGFEEGKEARGVLHGVGEFLYEGGGQVDRNKKNVFR